MSKPKEIISLNEDDFTDIENLFTNTLSSNIKSLLVNVQDRVKLRKLLAYLVELLDDEDNLIKKIKSIEKERNDLLIENNNK